MIAGTISIIICTRGREELLFQTLRSVAVTKIPGDWNLEVCVIDNSDCGDLEERFRTFSIKNATIVYRHCKEAGLDHARNAGLAAASGDLFVYVDDDVKVGLDWLERLTQPIRRGTADAVQGMVFLADEHVAKWMTRDHRRLYTEVLTSEVKEPSSLVGANMAFSRQVAEEIGSFDTYLDAGAIGYAGDTLFGFQAKENGARLVTEPRAIVYHHFELSRVSRSEQLQMMRRSGASWAYIHYHWEHSLKDFHSGFVLDAFIKLWVYRLARFGCFLNRGYASLDELNLVRELEKRRCLLRYAQEKPPLRYGDARSGRSCETPCL